MGWLPPRRHQNSVRNSNMLLVFVNSVDIKIKRRQKNFESGTINNFEIIQYNIINFRISCLYKLFWKSVYGSQNLVKLQYLNSKKYNVHSWLAYNLYIKMKLMNWIFKFFYRIWCASFSVARLLGQTDILIKLLTNLTWFWAPSSTLIRKLIPWDDFS